MKKLSRIIMLMILTLVMIIPVACTITPEKNSNGLVFEYDILTNSYAVVDYKANKDDIVILQKGVDGETENNIVVPVVEIPSEYKGKPVTKIKKGAFSKVYSKNRYDYPKYAAFDDEQDGSYAELIKEKNKVDLAYYAKVQKVVIPASVKVIEGYAFNNCRELKTVVLDNGVTEIQNSAFAACVKLQEIIVQQNGVNLAGAKTNQLPGALKEISDGAFYNCTLLKEIYIPKSVKKIGMLAFSKCESLTSLKVEKNDGSTFEMIGTDESILDADKSGVNVEMIDSYAFKDAIAMKYFNMPESVATINDGIFEMPKVADIAKGSQLVGVSFSKYITSLGAGMFKNCVSLDETKLDLSNIETIGEGIFEGCTSLTSIQLNDKITTIPKNAYKDCTGIVTVDITKYVVGENAQGDLIYGDTQVKVIGEGAFRGCDSLRSVELGADDGKLIQIKRYAFRDCPSLRSIYIPKSVYLIEPRIFENSNGTTVYYKYNEIKAPEGKVKEITSGFADGAANYITEFDSLVKEKDNSNKVVAEYIIKSGKAYLTRYIDSSNASYNVPLVINTNVPVIGVTKAAFKNCDNLEYVYFDAVNGVSNIESLESEAFANATALKEVDLSVVNITQIPDMAFLNSKNLEKVDLPKNVTMLGNSAFEGCSALEEVDFENVTLLGTAVFKDCGSLEKVTLGSIVTIPDRTFYNNDSLSSITVGNVSGIVTIGSKAFAGCSSLNETNFSLKDFTSLATINDEAFLNCSGYKTFYLPKKLTTIGSKVFTGCSSLTSFEIDKANKNFYVDSSMVLYKKGDKTFTLYYYETKADFDNASLSRKEKKNIKVTYYTELIFYPANSVATELNIEMHTSYTYSQLKDLIREEVGNPNLSIYAISGNTAASTNFAGNTYYANDGKIYTRKNNTSPVDKGETFTGEDYVVIDIATPKIANYAFEGAINLEKVTFTGNVTLGIGAFNNCPNLKEIIVEKLFSNDKNYSSDIGITYKEEDLENGVPRVKANVLYEGRYDVVEDKFIPTKLIQFPAGYEVERYEMPDTVTSIANNAFAGVKRIGTLVLSKNLDGTFSNLEKAFNKSIIGKFELNSKAGWVEKPVVNTDTGDRTYEPALVVLDEDGKYFYEYIYNYNGQTYTERSYLTVKEVIENSNGIITLDQYGILYYTGMKTKTVKIDGVDVKTSYVSYYQLIYVPSDIDLTERVLTIQDGCTVTANAFTGNSTLNSIVLGTNVSMVADSFDNCDNLKNIYYQSSPVDYVDKGYTDDKNFVDDNGYSTNLAFKNADVYYFSKDMIESEEYIYWGYESAINPENQATYEYDMTIDSAVPESLDGQPVIYQDNEYKEYYGFQYKLAKKYNEETEKYEYYQDDAGNWVFETNNFGEKQFILKFWNLPTQEPSQE